MSRSDHVKALSAQLEIDHHPLDTLLQFLGYDPEAMLNIGMSPQELLLMLSSEVVAKAESAEVAATLTGEQQAAILALASKAFHGRIANSVNANEDHPLVKQLNELAARNDVETREQFEFLKVLRNSKAFTEGVLTSLGKIATSFIRNETHPAFGRVISFIIKRFSGGALVPGLLKEYSELFWVCLKAGCEHDVVISKVQSFLADRKDDLGGDAHPMYAELYNFVQAYSLFLENIPTVQAPVVSVSDQQKDEGLDEKAGNLVAAIIMEVPVGPNDFAL
ncbi:MAG: hypothetical protein KDH94_08895, partial [Coxiellaceae bacterium]|nr:hypothetical protein [Coxiellaceae bacterium]